MERPTRRVLVYTILTLLLLISAGASGFVGQRYYMSTLTNSRLQHRVATLTHQLDTLNKAQVHKRQDVKQSSSQPAIIQSLATSGNKVLTIIYNRYGFDPNIDTVPLNSTVSIRNESSNTVRIEAVNWNGGAVANSPLNLGAIGSQQQVSFTFNTTQAVQYQANGNPAIRAEIKGQS